MAFPNRELSQFGSFLLINDTGSTIGIATTATPTIGIGTTRSDVKLTVIGDTNISGVVRASEFYRGSDLLVNATVDRWSSGSGNNIYRLNGNIGIGTTIPTQQIDATQTIKASRFISTVTSGTAPFTVSSDTVVPLLNASFVSGKSAPIGSIVGTTDTQTLTNKTIQSSNINVIGAGITFSGSISGTATLKAQSNAVSNTLTLPSTTGTLVSTGDTGSITSNMILDGTITNTDISSSAAIPYTKLTLTGTLVNNDLVNGTIQNAKLANSTISGVSLGSSLSNLIAGSYITYSGGSGAIFYNGSTNITASVNASSAVGSGNNIVARDANGDFTARNITLSYATVSETVQAADFNATGTYKMDGIVLIDSSKNIVNAGIITATKFVGDGSALTNLPSNSKWVITSVGIHTLSNVGIGTTNPVTTLDVNGSIKGCITRQTAQSPTSGTTVTFSSIPSWARKITIMFDSVASSSTTDLTVQLGTGAGPTFTTTGYKGSVMGIQPGTGGIIPTINADKSLFSAAFIAHNDMTSGGSIFGNMYLTNITGNTWIETSILNDSVSTTTVDSCYGSGSIALSATLTAVRIVCGAFSAGTVNIMYEG
jgi:hypothetical protein